MALGLLGFGLGEVRARRAERRSKRAEDVSPWDEVRWLSGDLFAVKNSSTRDVLVLSLEPDFVVTAEHVENFSVPHPLPFRVNAGDSVEFRSEARLTLPRPSALIGWQFVDGNEVRSTRRIVTGPNASAR